MLHERFGTNMSISEKFDRKFSKCMRGYNPEEVDAAVDALLRYCDDLDEANREFEIANNDLIDERNSLYTDKTELTKKVDELSEKLTKIETVYNEYREKYGEAQEIVNNAKVSAAEILTRAQTKADLYIEEAEKKRLSAIKSLDSEIAQRKSIIEALEKTFNDFKEKLLGYINSTSLEIKNWNSKSNIPEIPNNINLETPHKKNEATASIKKMYSNEVVHDINRAKPTGKADAIQQNASTAETDTSNVTVNDKVKEVKHPKEPPLPNIPGIPLMSANSAAFTEVQKNKMGEKTPTSKIKSSVELINNKVIAKKSTPHI